MQGTRIGVLGLKMTKNGHFGPFQSPPLRGEKILTIEIWLNKSLISLLWPGFKISMKTPSCTADAPCQIFALAETIKEFVSFILKGV